jgi:hypothetical protein
MKPCPMRPSGEAVSRKDVDKKVKEKNLTRKSRSEVDTKSRLNETI